MVKTFHRKLAHKKKIVRNNAMTLPNRKGSRNSVHCGLSEDRKSFCDSVPMIASRNIIKDNKERMKNMPRRIFRVIVIRLKFDAIKEWLQDLLTSVLKPSTFRMNMHMCLL